jgi:hypothetical protein
VVLSLFLSEISHTFSKLSVYLACWAETTPPPFSTYADSTTKRDERTVKRFSVLVMAAKKVWFLGLATFPHADGNSDEFIRI